jgi:L-asparaginase II
MRAGSDAVVTALRGRLLESVHVVSWVVADAAGRILVESGEGAGERPALPRSAAKPLQALVPVGAGIPERYGLGEEHLALACGSHSGDEEAAGICLAMLRACGLRASDLRCGTTRPRDPAAAESRAEWGPLHHMCSGNHALALAWTVREGVDPATYLDPSAPVQVAMRNGVAVACGLDPTTMREGLDGCGMPAYEVPLAGLAAAYGRLASGGLGAAGERTAQAMRRNPELVAFHGAVDTELMRAVDGLVAKVGAEGVLAIGLADGRGLALKVHDGAERAIGPAAVLLAREVLELPARGTSLDTLARPPVLAAGRHVAGELVAGFADASRRPARFG